MQDFHISDARMRGLGARLSRTRAVVWTVIAVERLWPLFLPIAVIISLFLSLSWLGVFRLLPDWGRFALLGVLALGLLASLVPFRKFRLPSSPDVDRRIETANRLEHAPLLTQTDRLAAAADDPFARALWLEHQKRMAERLSRLQGDLPRTDIPERDPYALRAAAALLFVVAAAYATGPQSGSVLDAFRAPVSTSAHVAARIDAWVTPPPYTGRPPIFLTADANREKTEFLVPENSTFSVRISNGSGARL